MRDKKFRAYHGLHECMLENREQGFEGEVFKWKAEGQSIVIMQWTGLLDKNGVEIYEGDIVHWPHIASANLLIQYNQAECAFVADTQDGNPDSWLDSKCEVIGNVHENSELLEHQ